MKLKNCTLLFTLVAFELFVRAQDPVHTKPKGSMTCKVCHDHACLPPKTWNFQIAAD